jgi:hypothetical protein
MNYKTIIFVVISSLGHATGLASSYPAPRECLRNFMDSNRSDEARQTFCDCVTEGRTGPFWTLFGSHDSSRKRIKQCVENLDSWEFQKRYKDDAIFHAWGLLNAMACDAEWRHSVQDLAAVAGGFIILSAVFFDYKLRKEKNLRIQNEQRFAVEHKETFQQHLNDQLEVASIALRDNGDLRREVDDLKAKNKLLNKDTAQILPGQKNHDWQEEVDKLKVENELLKKDTRTLLNEFVNLGSKYNTLRNEHINLTVEKMDTYLLTVDKNLHSKLFDQDSLSDQRIKESKD